MICKGSKETENSSFPTYLGIIFNKIYLILFVDEKTFFHWKIFFLDKGGYFFHKIFLSKLFLNYIFDSESHEHNFPNWNSSLFDNIAKFFSVCKKNIALI